MLLLKLDKAAIQSVCLALGHMVECVLVDRARAFKLLAKLLKSSKVDVQVLCVFLLF
jgi:hypothetical protein